MLVGAFSLGGRGRQRNGGSWVLWCSRPGLNGGFGLYERSFSVVRVMDGVVEMNGEDGTSVLMVVVGCGSFRWCLRFVVWRQWCLWFDRLVVRVVRGRCWSFCSQ